MALIMGDVPETTLLTQGESGQDFPQQSRRGPSGETAIVRTRLEGSLLRGLIFGEEKS